MEALKIIKWIYCKKIVAGRLQSRTYIPVIDANKYLLDSDDLIYWVADEWASAVDSVQPYHVMYELLDMPDEEWLEKQRVYLQNGIQYDTMYLMAINSLLGV